MSEQKHELDEDLTSVREVLLCEIGSKLKETRESKGYSQEHVIKELKLSHSFLAALETGEWSKMPGEVYALGFLRQYANLLALDVSSDIEKIKTNTYELTIPLTYPDAPISPNRTWVVSAILLFFLIIILTNLLDSEDKQTKVAQLKPETTVSKDKIIKESGEKQSSESIKTSPVQSLDTPAIEVIAKPIQNSSADIKRAYTFSAVSDDAWLQVYQKFNQNEPLLQREVLLKKGESFKLERKPLLLLTSGNPTALKIERDGEILFSAGELGQKGKVLKLFPID